MNESQVLEKIVSTLPAVNCCHSRTSALYDLLRIVARKEVERLFSDRKNRKKTFKPFGELVFPYHKMGAVDSLNLFDLDELIIFSFYWLNRKKYRRVVDIGANIGLHSIMLDKCGYNVRCYEPDPQTFTILQRNLKLNKCAKVKPFNEAVSSKEGKLEFIRVCGNITGSQRAGYKENPYGKLERFPVRVEAIKPIIEWADLIKLDAEGHEKEIILATNRKQWLGTDAFIEVESSKNATAVYAHFKKLRLNLFSQKLNWQRVKSVKDIPISYKQGSLFVTGRDRMPWE